MTERLPTPPSQELFQVDSPTVLIQSPLPESTGSETSTSPAFSGVDPEDLGEIALRQQTRRAQVIRMTFWIFLSLSTLLIFSYLKLPDTKIKALIQGYLNVALAGRGASLTSERSEIGLLFGLKYEMEGVQIYLPAPHPPVMLDSVSVRPSLWRILFQEYSASLTLDQGDATMKAFVSLSPKPEQPDKMVIQFTGDHLDGSKLGVLPLVGGPNGTFRLDGEGDLTLDLKDFTKSTGEVELELKNITVEQQRYSGFSLPKLQISQALLHFKFTDGKLKLLKAEFGPNPDDDFRATVSGEAKLARTWNASTLDFKAQFQFSPKIIKAFSLIDALLSQGKTGEGQYAYSISGTPTVPNFGPAK